MVLRSRCVVRGGRTHRLRRRILTLGVAVYTAAVTQSYILLRGSLVNRTYDGHKNLYIHLFL